MVSLLDFLESFTEDITNNVKGASTDDIKIAPTKLNHWQTSVVRVLSQSSLNEGGDVPQPFHAKYAAL